MLCRQGIGFSPEIETVIRRKIGNDACYVARGLASRLRLKQPGGNILLAGPPSRQGIGFSPEIETVMMPAVALGTVTSPGDWLLA